MLWYGFCIEGNEYDSYPLRLWSYVKSDKVDENKLEELVFNEYVDDDEYEDGIEWAGVKHTIDDLTKEFRLKSSKVCLDFITYLRVYFLTTLKQNVRKPLLITVPSSIEFERRVFDFAYKILWALKRKVFTRSIEEDEKELLNPNLNYKKRLAIILTKEHKIIIQTQLNITKLIQRMLAEMDTDIPIGLAVVKKYDDIESTEIDYQQNRERIRHYIQ